jgi:purine-nucleoside phosphorylase
MRAQVEETSDFVRQHTQHHPTIGIILGSGLSPLADDIEEPDILPYGSIPHFQTSTVKGHAGRLVIGVLQGQKVVTMQGRIHYYEGYSMPQLTFPVRVMCSLGIRVLVVTNAAGGLNTTFSNGELMLISDHLNLVGMAGHHPLIGPNDPELGPRFPDMSQAYDPELRALVREVAKAQGVPLREGVYACLAGPSFETPAEVRFLRLIGADAVGMSTVPEVTVARHMGVRVVGISGITNVHASDSSPPQETCHQEVLEAGQVIAPRLLALLHGFLKRL